MVFHSRKTHTTKSKLDLAQWWPYMLHCGMVFIVAAYVLAGAEIIRRIEAKTGNQTQETIKPPTSRVKRQPEHEIRHSVSRTKNCVLTTINKIAVSSNCAQNLGDVHLQQLDRCYLPELLRLQEKPHEQQKVPASSSADQDMWSLTDAVLFCFTVITTIGYGNVVPRTDMGRLFVIFYGLIGVPITMLVIANLGKFLATLLKLMAKPFIRCVCGCRKACRTRSGTTKEKQRLVEKQSKLEKCGSDGSSTTEEEPEVEDNAATDGAVLFLSFIVYIIVGSLIIAAYEPDMDFFSAIYFNFVTLTTIGLGDLVPQKGEWLVFTLIYVAVGLALTTIAIEIAADTLKKLHYFGRKIENVGNVQIWFGGQKISMKALVKNLGDQLNVPIEDLENLNIDKFVDDAIKVEAGELSTLRTLVRQLQVGPSSSQQDRDWMNSAYWRAIESGSMHYVDDDDLVTLQSNRSDRLFLRLAASGSKTPIVEISEHAPFVPTPRLPTPIAAISSSQVPYGFRNANLLPPPAIGMGTRPIPNIEEGAEQLIKTYKKTKRERDVANSRWSAEAKKRYDEYQKIWSQYRQTSPRDNEKPENGE